MKGIIDYISQGKPAGYIAAKFHCSLAKLVKMLAGQAGVRKIAFSGGVFQNSLLTDMIIQLMEGEYELLFHKELSPNDENVSFGQLMCYMIEKESEK